MAAIGNMTSQEEIEMKAGDGLNTTSFGTASMALAAIGAEGVVNCAARYDFSTAISDGTLTGSAKTGIFGNIVASLVAIDGIKTDMSGYQSRIVAEDNVNILRDSVLRDLSIVRDIKTQEWLAVK